jgi:hypothetical protein
VRSLFAAFACVALSLVAVGCGSGGNESNVNAPPMGDVVPVPGAAVPPPPVITDSSAYADRNVDTSSAAK